MRRYLQVTANAFLLTIAMWLLFLATACRVQMVYEPIPVVFHTLNDPENAGITVCDSVSNLPRVFLQPQVRESPALYPIVFHEMVHAKQALNYKEGGCQGMMKKYNADIWFRFKVEAEAYCETYKMYVKPEFRVIALASLKERVWKAHGFNEKGVAVIPQEVAYNTIASYCGEAQLAWDNPLGGGNDHHPPFPP